MQALRRHLAGLGLLRRPPRLHRLIADRLERRRVVRLPRGVRLRPHEGAPLGRRAVAVQLKELDAAPVVS